MRNCYNFFFSLTHPLTPSLKSERGNRDLQELTVRGVT